MAATPHRTVGEYLEELTVLRLEQTCFGPLGGASLSRAIRLQSQPDRLRETQSGEKGMEPRMQGKEPGIAQSSLSSVSE